MKLRLGLFSILFVTTALAQAPDKSASCGRLATLALPNTSVTLAQAVPAGEFVPPGAAGGPPGGSIYKDLPSFCRVAATIKPTSDSDIKIEVWMPLSGWNGKLQAVGNGGWSGAIGYPALARALGRGYATAGTDTGHSGGSASFALGHPEKLIDFAYRSEHEMTVNAKAIIAAFYGERPRFSYWNGCSSGGKQGLKEAQRFPGDFDGIIAGAPANNWTHLMVSGVWMGQATLKDPASLVPKSKYELIHKAVLEACDGRDGVKDGILEDPVRCHFDPKVLECKNGDEATCLTAPQVEAVKKIYGPSRNPRTGAEIFPGLEPGSELGWAAMVGGPKPFPITEDHFKYVVFKDPNWDFRSLNFDSDVALTDKLDNGLLSATDPNLKDFLAHGGKLLLYHGWNDQLIAPRNTINYYQSVVSAMGADKVKDSVRLFMAPGMNHCAGGDGPNSFDTVSVMEQWVENGKPPDQIVASHTTNGAVDRTRPLCPYPQTAKYKGTGSTDDALNFVCAK